MANLIFYIVFTVSISGLYVWMFLSHNKKEIKSEGNAPQDVNINLNIYTGKEGKKVVESSSSPSKKSSEIPIESESISDLLNKKASDTNLKI